MNENFIATAMIAGCRDEKKEVKVRGCKCFLPVCGCLGIEINHAVKSDCTKK
jgi:hypothetical protein